MNYDVQKLARSQLHRASRERRHYYAHSLCVYLSYRWFSSWPSIHEGLQSLDDDRHVRPEIGLVLDAQRRHRRELQIERRTGSQFTREMLAQRKWGNAVRVQISTAAYLGHGFRRVVILQLGIHALLHFVLAQSRSGLNKFVD